MNLAFVMWQHSTFPQDFPRGALGGAETAVWSIAGELRHRHQVTIFCRGTEDTECIIDGVTLSRVKSFTGSKWVSGDIYYHRAVKKAEDSEMIIGITCMEPAFFSNKVSIHLENDLDPYVPFPAPKARIYRRSLLKARLVTGVSQYVSKRFLQKFEFKNRVAKVHNGADCSFFSPEKRDRQRLREDFGIAENEIVVTYAGAIHRRKGLHLLVDAISRIKSDSIRLLVIGGLIYSKKRPVDAQYLEDQIARIDHLPGANFAGPVGREKLTWLMASSDIFVCPSIWQDPCPLVCAEAQASGTPTIGFNVGGVPELIDDGNTGFVGDPRSSFLEDGIGLLAGDDRLRRQFSKNARKRAIRLLDWREISERMDRLLSEVV